jgi:hypothetical protein
MPAMGPPLFVQGHSALAATTLRARPPAKPHGRDHNCNACDVPFPPPCPGRWQDSICDRRIRLLRGNRYGERATS